MTQFHQRKLPDFSTLLCGRTPPDDIGFESEKLWVWYNNTDKDWWSVGETPHMHTIADECFIVLRGTLIVEVSGERFEVGKREFCCFPAGTYHAIVLYLWVFSVPINIGVSMSDYGKYAHARPKSLGFQEKPTDRVS